MPRGARQDLGNAGCASRGTSESLRGTSKQLEGVRGTSQVLLRGTSKTLRGTSKTLRGTSKQLEVNPTELEVSHWRSAVGLPESPGIEPEAVFFTPAHRYGPPRHPPAAWREWRCPRPAPAVGLSASPCPCACPPPAHSSRASTCRARRPRSSRAILPLDLGVTARPCPPFASQVWM